MLCALACNVSVQSNVSLSGVEYLSVFGTLTLPKGADLTLDSAECSVYLDPFPRIGHIDTSGVFAFHGVEPGLYSLHIHSPHCAFEKLRFKLHTDGKFICTGWDEKNILSTDTTQFLIQGADNNVQPRYPLFAWVRSVMSSPSILVMLTALCVSYIVPALITDEEMAAGTAEIRSFVEGWQAQIAQMQQQVSGS